MPMSAAELRAHAERLGAWLDGAGPDAEALAAATADFRAALGTFLKAGDLLPAVSAACLLSVALRLGARGEAEDDAVPVLREACETAERGRDAAIEHAETNGVDEANTAAYVSVTNEAGEALSALGEALRRGEEAERSFRAAAARFGEAAAGYRRLGTDGDARRAEIRALGARASAALAAGDP